MSLFIGESGHRLKFQSEFQTRLTHHRRPAQWEEATTEIGQEMKLAFSHYPIHLSPCLAISNPPTALYSLLFSSSFNLYTWLDCLVCYVCVTDLKIHANNDITALPVLWDCGWGREQHSCCWEDVMAAPFTKCCVMILPHKPITMGLATHTTCSLDSCITSFSVVCRAVIVCLIT